MGNARISMPIIPIGYVAQFVAPDPGWAAFDGLDCIVTEKAMTDDKNVLYKIRFQNNGPIIWASRMMLR